LSEWRQLILCLYTKGHGTKLRDDDFGEEKDGYDEALCPRDFASAGMIRDDDLYDILVKGCPDGVHMVSLMDCCHVSCLHCFVVVPYHTFSSSFGSTHYLDVLLSPDPSWIFPTSSRAMEVRRK
jgi:hypothetical protein